MRIIAKEHFLDVSGGAIFPALIEVEGADIGSLSSPFMSRAAGGDYNFLGGYLAASLIATFTAGVAVSIALMKLCRY